MKEPRIGDFVTSTDGHAGIVTAVKDNYYGRMIFIIEADGRVYHFPLADLGGGYRMIDGRNNMGWFLLGLIIAFGVCGAADTKAVDLGKIQIKKSGIVLLS